MHILVSSRLSTSKNEIRFARTMSPCDIAFIVGNSVKMSFSHLFLGRTKIRRRIYKSEAKFGPRFVVNSFCIEIWSLRDCDRVHHKHKCIETAPELMNLGDRNLVPGCIIIAFGLWLLFNHFSLGEVLTAWHDFMWVGPLFCGSTVSKKPFWKLNPSN